MSILRDFEKRLEGAVEGFFARAFRSGLQPVELAKALQRYAGNYQQVGLDDQVFVPNVYRFALSRDDTERFAGFESSLRRELGEVVARTAADRGWRLQGAPRVELVVGDHIRTGTYELRGKVEAPEPPARPAQVAAPVVPRPAPVGAAPQPYGGQQYSGQPYGGQQYSGQQYPGQGQQYGGAGQHDREGATRVMPATSPAPAELVTADGGRFPVRGTAVIGRLPECEVTLDDPAVSRRHARVTSTSDGGYTVEDLGSTNGVRLNGEPVTRAALRDGDSLDLGGVRISVAIPR